MESTRSRIGWVAFAVILVGFAVCAFGQLRLATTPGWQDTEGYLGHSLYIAEHGGWPGFLKESLAGTFPITERHPMYLLMLSPFASRSMEFFWNAKVLDLACGLITLATMLILVRRRFGEPASLIAGTVFAVSQTLLVASSHVNHETQFMLFMLLAWYWLTKAEDTKSWAIAGIWTGLAYFTKSSAILLIASVVTASVLHHRWRAFFHPRLWAFLLTTALFCSPMLIRNVRGYGKLVYEGVNSSIMWLDKWSELGGQHSIMYYGHYGYKTIEKNGLPTAKQYLRKHGIIGIVGRLLTGVRTELAIVAPKALMPSFPLPKAAAMGWGALWLLLAFVGLCLDWRSWQARLTWIASAAFVVFFGWNKLFPEMRYLAPLVPVWLAYGGWVVAKYSRLATQAAALPAMALLVAGAGWTAANGSLTSAQPVVAVSPAYTDLLAWMEKNTVEGDRILTGPSEQFYGLFWSTTAPVKIIQTPDVRSLKGFLRYLKERKVTYFVLHTENAYGWGGQLADALAPYAEVTKEGEIVEKQALPGWKRVYEDPNKPRKFYIYRQEDVR